MQERPVQKRVEGGPTRLGGPAEPTAYSPGDYLERIFGTSRLQPLPDAPDLEKTIQIARRGRKMIQAGVLTHLCAVCNAYCVPKDTEVVPLRELVGRELLMVRPEQPERPGRTIWTDTSVDPPVRYRLQRGHPPADKRSDDMPGPDEGVCTMPNRRGVLHTVVRVCESCSGTLSHHLLPAFSLALIDAGCIPHDLPL